MGDWITVTGVKPYDGRYELDLDGAPLTTREWGWIKRHAGYLPITLTGEAFTDPELITMLAVIAMRRKGTITPEQVPDLWDRFSDSPFGSAITLTSDTVEDADAGPPDGSSNGSSSTSGESSPTGSETSDAPPSPTGSPPSGTSLSVPVTSVS